MPGSTKPNVSLASVGLALALCAGGVSSAHAQWTVINLHPAGMVNSEAHAIYGAQQVGVTGVTPYGRLEVVLVEQSVDALEIFLELFGWHDAIFNNWQGFEATFIMGNDGGGATTNLPQFILLLGFTLQLIGDLVLVENFLRLLGHPSLLAVIVIIKFD